MRSGSLLPVPPAVANAVYDAVGVRVDEVPLSPPRVLKALRSGDRRYGPAAPPAVPWPRPVRVPPPWEGGDGRATEDPERESRDSRAAEEGTMPRARAAAGIPREGGIENVPGAER